MKTSITELVKIEHPIFLAGMHGVSSSELAAAVSEAGGCGVLGADGWSPERVKDECQRVRAKTQKPFGVDFLLALDDNPVASVRVAIDEGATVLVAGLGVPARIVDMCHEARLVVMALAGKVEHAVRAVDAGCDVVIAQGAEAGGHTGSVGSVALWPQVVDAVRVPVLAAGGVNDGRGLVAALAMGCAGVWVGTRFVASVEARAHPRYKEKLVAATASDTVVSRCWTGKTLRALKNETTDHFTAHPEEVLPAPEQFFKMAGEGLLGFSIGPDLEDDRVERACWPAGQGCGGIEAVLTSREIVEGMMKQANAIMAGMQR